MTKSTRKRILLVEDEAIFAINEKMQLEKYDYVVSTVTTGEKAVDAVETSSDFDLILMDINLGAGIDGTQAAEIILKDHDIPILFLSSHTEPEIVEMTEKITSYGYVVKDSSVTVLDASIKMAFRLFYANKKLTEELTERERVEGALRESEEKFRALFEKAPIGVAYHKMVYDDSGNVVDYRFLDANDSYLELTGVDPRGKCATEAFPGIEHDPFDWIRTFGRVARTGEQIRFEQHLEANNRWYDCVAYQVEPDCFVAAFTEITERKRMVDAMSESVTRYQELVELVPVGVYIFWTRANGLMEFEYVSDRWCAIHGLRREDVLADAMVANNIVHPEDRGSLLERNREAAREQRQFVWEGRFFKGDGEQRRLRIESTPAAVENGDTRWFGVTQDITDSKRFEYELASQKEYLEAILETTPEGFWIVTPEKKITDVNSAYSRMVGYSKDELAGMYVNDLDAVESWQETDERVKRIMENGSETFETQHRRKDGSLLDLEMSASRFDLSEGTFLICFGRDITDRKQSETQIAESVRLLSRAQEIAHLGNWHLDLTENRLFWSDEVYRIFGCEPQEFAATYEAFLGFVHIDDRDAVDEAYSHSLRNRSSGYEIEHRIIRRDSGEVRYVHERCDHDRDDAGNIVRSTGMVQDITEQKLAQQQLFERNSLLNEVLENMLDLVAITDLDGFFLYAGRSHEILGYSASSLIGRNVMDFVHKDDLEQVNKALADFLESGNSPTVEYRYRCADGSYVYLESAGRLLNSENGVPSKILFNTRDITERKRNMESLRDSQQLNRALFDQALSAIYISDMSGNFIEVNSTACNKSGYTREELLEMTVFDLNDPDALRPGKEALLDEWSRWKPGVQYNFESIYVKKDRTRFPVLISTGAVFYGDTTAIAAAVLDISEQKRAEEAVQRLLTEKEMLIKEIQHRIKNNINTMTSLLSLQAQTLEEPTAVAALEEARNRMNTLEELYDYLYGTDTIGKGSLREYLRRLVDSEVALFPQGKHVAVRSQIEDCICATKTLSTLGLIVNELVTNAIKYAFREQPNPELTVTGVHRNEHYVLTIKDNGPGIVKPDESHSSSGFGLMIVNVLTEQLDGTIRFEIDNGARITLEFPISEERGFSEAPRRSL